MSNPATVDDVLQLLLDRMVSMPTDPEDLHCMAEAYGLLVRAETDRAQLALAKAA